MLKRKTKRVLTRFCFAALMVAMWANAHHASANEATIKAADKWQRVAAEQTANVCERVGLTERECIAEAIPVLKEGQQIARDYLAEKKSKLSDPKKAILVTFGGFTHTIDYLCAAHADDPDSCKNQAMKEFFHAVD